MEKINKKDKINLIIITVIFIGIIVFILRNKTLYGSILDWNTQHSVIPEYFRSLFYKTLNIFPDFALNLGSGQNIYNYSYYGLFNPVIIISYFFPFISMKSYIQVSSIVLVYSSVLLFYNFLKHNKFNSDVCLLGSIVFMTATPLLFHSHRHIMFMNYMPFLVLALFGVDKYFEKKDSRLLCISVILIILMSYYYSIPAIISIVVYGVYKYIILNKKITFKSFMIDGIKFLIPIMIGILITSILLVPTFYAILNGRLPNDISISISDLIVPKINIKYLMYNSYGVGLTSFALIGLLVLLLDKKRESRFLFICLTSLIVFPFINYLLNGTMYIDAKVLIPFMPLYVFVVTLMFNKIYSKKIDINKLLIVSVITLFLIYVGESNYVSYFYLDFIITLVVIILSIKVDTKYLLKVFTIVVLVIYSIGANNKDTLVNKNDIYNDENKNQEALVKKVPKGYNHTTLYNLKLENVNNIYGNLNIYSNYIYSSTGNSNYNIFMFDTLESPMQSRNRLIISANKDLMYLMLSNNKYFIGDDVDITGYKKIDSIGNTGLYENEDVLPFMYVSYNYYNKKDFSKLKFPYNNEVILNNVVVNEKTNNEFSTNIKETFIRQSDIKYMDPSIVNNGNNITVKKNNSRMLIDVPDDARNKIIFVSFELEPQSCRAGDLGITINGNLNKLTCKEWKYYNGNTTFNYVISGDTSNKVDVSFFKGIYNIKNLKIYYMDYNDIKNVKDKVTEVNISDKTKGDKIYVSVETEKDGYFVTTLPYDRGFKIKVDGKKVDYEKVNTAYVGFKLEKGKHNIVIEYKAPFKTLGLVMSLIGILIYIIYYHGDLIKINKKK